MKLHRVIFFLKRNCQILCVVLSFFFFEVQNFWLVSNEIMKLFRKIKIIEIVRYSPFEMLAVFSSHEMRQHKLTPQWKIGHAETLIARLLRIATPNNSVSSFIVPTPPEGSSEGGLYRTRLMGMLMKAHAMVVTGDRSSSNSAIFQSCWNFAWFLTSTRAVPRADRCVGCSNPFGYQSPTDHSIWFQFGNNHNIIKATQKFRKNNKHICNIMILIVDLKIIQTAPHKLGILT